MMNVVIFCYSYLTIDVKQLKIMPYILFLITTAATATNNLGNKKSIDNIGYMRSCIGKGPGPSHHW
jgi:hypothetical protein